MNAKYHFAASTAISGILYALVGTWTITIASFVTGVFIDIDHLIDYMVVHGPRFQLKDFFSFFYDNRYTTVFLILHGWEWLFLMTFATWLSGWNPWFTGALIGWGQHMFFDKIFNTSLFRSYSLLWRWSRGFDKKRIPLGNRR